MRKRKVIPSGAYLAGVLACLSLLAAAPGSIASDATDAVLANLRLPAGFVIEVYTDAVPNARSMTLGAEGTLFVGTRTAGKVYAVSRAPGSGRAARVRVIGERLNVPNGVAFRHGSLYVAEVNRILRFDDIEQHLDAPPAPTVVRDDFPRDRHHGWKYIAFGPDDRLYVPIGAPCNVCDQDGYAVITRMNPDGSDREVFARGVRNTVGFTWHPQTRELWFTDNGRDWMGDDLPPCELNRAPQSGLHFGFPFCHGKDIVDPEFGDRGVCTESVPPVQDLGAHVAPLGIRFHSGRGLPEIYRNRVFIAEHGSWNRSDKSGYRITMVTLDGNRAVAYEPFATGFYTGDEVHGRPVDLLEMNDGSLLVSDDHAGAVYRITYRNISNEGQQ